MLGIFLNFFHDFDSSFGNHVRSCYLDCRRYIYPMRLKTFQRFWARKFSNASEEVLVYRLLVMPIAKPSFCPLIRYKIANFFQVLAITWIQAKSANVALEFHLALWSDGSFLHLIFGNSPDVLKYLKA